MEWAAAAPWLAWAAAFLADAGRHQERPCERCIAASPLDPEAAVSRWEAALLLHHRKAAKVTALSAALAWDVASAVVRHPPWWANALDVPALAVVGAGYVVAWQHRWMHPDHFQATRPALSGASRRIA